jgi:hypothetical protein
MEHEFDSLGHVLAWLGAPEITSHPNKPARANFS